MVNKDFHIGPTWHFRHWHDNRINLQQKQKKNVRLGQVRGCARIGSILLLQVLHVEMSKTNCTPLLMRVGAASSYSELKP